MRIYRGSDADIVLRPFMVRLSEIVSFDLQLWTSGTYMVKRSTSESGMTTDKGNNLINVHFTDKETGYLDAGVLNAKLMYRITDSEYPDGTYDGIITIPQEYYLMTPPDFSGATIEKVYESGYTEGYNTAIQNSVLSINGEKGDLKLKTVNGNELLGEGNINIKALKYFELTQERAREAYNEIQNHWDDKSGYTGDFIFYYKKENGGVYTFSEIGYLKDHSVYFNYLNNAGAYDVNTGNIKFFAIIIWKDGYNLHTYENDFAIPTKTSQLTNDSAFQTKSEVDTAIENAISGVGGVESLNNQTGALKIKTIDNKDVLGEGNMDILSDYNICMFMMYNLTLSEADKGIIVYKYGIGDDAANLDKYFSGFKTIQFLHFNIKDGASYKVPVTVFWDGNGNRQFRFVCEGYEYTYTSIDANYCDFTSKVKIGGESGLKYKQITNESRQEVYDDVKAHWNNASGYTGDYVYFYQNGVDQIIFDEVKFENNTAYFNSASVGYTSGQVHNPLVRLLCCIVPSEGNIQINENGRVLSDVNGMRYEAEDAIVDSNSITFQENGYGDGYDVYNTTDTGTKDGLFDVRFRNGLNGFKGNAPASIFTDGTDVFMAFDVVDNHYVYKRDGNAWAFVSKTKIGGESGGDQNVIVLDGLTQEERKAVYDKLDKTKAPDEVFVYEGKTSVKAYWGGGNYLKFITFNDNYDGLKVEMYSLNPDGNLEHEERGMTYTNSVLMHLGNHVDESGYFECMYIGNFFEYILRPYTRPNACFINLEKGIGDSTRPIYAPVSTLVEKYGDRNNVRMQFIANEKLYTFLLDSNQDNKWIFESAKPITGGGSGESSKTYYFYNDPTRDPNTPNAHNVEVFRAFDKAVQEGGAFNNFYIVNGNETSGQKPYNPILQVTKMANGEWGANKGYYVFAGQKSNVETEKLQVHKYCLTDIGGVIDFMVNAVDGGTWTSGVHSKIDDVLTAGQDIPFVFEYLEGCDETYFWADNMGGKQGLYNITFNGGYDGYKGNVVADVYGNDTGVYMAFTVNNVRYTYKKNDTNSKWELAKSVQIGGVQSAEVSNIKVLTQSEYDALTPKDPNTMYCIKGQ